MLYEAKPFVCEEEDRRSRAFIQNRFFETCGTR